jgi:hypothetical protein
VLLELERAHLWRSSSAYLGLKKYLLTLTDVSKLIYATDMAPELIQKLEFARLVEFPELSTSRNIKGNHLKSLTEKSLHGKYQFKRRFNMILGHFNGTVCVADGDDEGAAMMRRVEMIKFSRADNLTETSLLESADEQNLAAHYVALLMKNTYRVMKIEGKTFRSMMPADWRKAAEEASQRTNYVMKAVVEHYKYYPDNERAKVPGGELRQKVLHYCSEHGITLPFNTADPRSCSAGVLAELRRGGWTKVGSGGKGNYTHIAKKLTMVFRQKDFSGSKVKMELPSRSANKGGAPSGSQMSSVAERSNVTSAKQVIPTDPLAGTSAPPAMSAASPPPPPVPTPAGSPVLAATHQTSIADLQAQMAAFLAAQQDMKTRLDKAEKDKEAVLRQQAVLAHKLDKAEKDKADLVAEIAHLRSSGTPQQSTSQPRLPLNQEAAEEVSE